MFHAFPNFFTGGFIGVDIFFVISGYLISGILVDARPGPAVQLSRFLLRRVRRIFPSLIVVIAASPFFGWYVLFPDEFARLGKQLAAGAGFATNFFYGPRPVISTYRAIPSRCCIYGRSASRSNLHLWPARARRRSGGVNAACSSPALSMAACRLRYNVIGVVHHASRHLLFAAGASWELLGGVLACLVGHGRWVPQFHAHLAAAGLLLLRRQRLHARSGIRLSRLVGAAADFRRIAGGLSAGFTNWISK